MTAAQLVKFNEETESAQSDIVKPFTSTDFVQLDNGKAVLYAVCQTMIGSECVQLLIVTNNIPALTNFEAQLCEFLEKWQRIRLKRALNAHVPKMLRRKTNDLISNPLTKRQLNAFFTKMFFLLFHGQQMLGSDANIDGLRTNLVEFIFDKFLSQHEGRCRRAEFCKGIRFNQIPWLHGVRFCLKERIVGNLCEYMLRLFMGIFRAHFYSTINNVGRIVHYRRSIWRRIARESFELFRAERNLQPVENSSVDEMQLAIHKIRFLPKQQNTRPITSIPSTWRRRQHTREVLAVLRYIMQRNAEYYGWGISFVRLFQFAYRRFCVKHQRDNHKKPVYFCVADLRNCYNSLDHAFLEKLLQAIMPAECKYTVVQARVCNSLLNYRTTRTYAGSTYSEAIGRLKFALNEQIISNPIITQVGGAELLERIRRYSMRTCIRVPANIYDKNTAARTFVCNRGIAQGNQLSVCLCNLYLGAMEREIFPFSPRGLLCRRYVDDYILMAYKRENIEHVKM